MGTSIGDQLRETSLKESADYLQLAEPAFATLSLCSLGFDEDLAGNLKFPAYQSVLWDDQ